MLKYNLMILGNLKQRSSLPAFAAVNIIFIDSHRNLLKFKLLTIIIFGQWFGSIGRAVTSDTRGPRFDSSHMQIFTFKELLP